MTEVYAISHAEWANHPYTKILQDQVADLSAKLHAIQSQRIPFCYVSLNKQGDVTRTTMRKDSWCKKPLYE